MSYLLRQIAVIICIMWPVIVCCGVAVLSYILGFPRSMLIIESFLLLVIGMVFGSVWNKYLYLSKSRTKIYDFFGMSIHDRNY